MTWGDEGRQLPPEWPAIREKVKDRALKSSKLGFAQCEAFLPRSGKRCPDPGTDADHIGDRDDHRLFKLRWKCHHHHSKKTAAEGHAAWAAKKAPKKTLRRDEHPGRRLG